MRVEFDRHSLIINGKREFVWGGAIHYFRLPSVREWPLRLKMMRQAGLNAVDVYIPWNYHSEAEGAYDFKGIRDLGLYLDMVEDSGMYLIARPGPYICAEIDGGGIPGWLISKKEPVIRCRHEGRLVYDPEYMKYARQWWEEVVPRVADRKNLILFQIENEFNLIPSAFQSPARDILKIVRQYNPKLQLQLGSSEIYKLFVHKIAPKLKLNPVGEAEANQYAQDLYDWSRELGIKVPIFHNDVMSHSGRVREVDIMAIDDYPITDFSRDWRKNKFNFLPTDGAEEGLESYRNDNPMFAAEFQGSWFDNWGGYGYDAIRKMLGPDQLDIATKTILSQRATLISYFMFCGATTWGYMTSPDVYTSYDKGAPISEAGLATERYEAIRRIIKEINSLGQDFLETEVDDTVKCRRSEIFCRARKSAGGKRYVFVRNMSGRAMNFRVNIIKDRIKMENAEMRLLVVGAGGKVEKEIGPIAEGSIRMAVRAKPKLPALDKWTLAWASPQIYENFDARDWRLLEGETDWTLDGLGTHYGYGWYRGTFRGRIKSISIDARHCLSVYLNGGLVASKDNFRNYLGLGDDCAELFDIPVSQSRQHGDLNVITVLVESLGHNKDFESDIRNPRGVISLKTKGSKVVWRFRGGLLNGEKGLCPVLPKKAFADLKPKRKVSLPHFWEPDEDGVGVYETVFDLDIKDPDASPIGIVIPEALSKANIYVNGYLMGRYWHEKGPQNKFYAPWGVLNPKGKNHIAIAVWKRWETGCLGTVRLEAY